LNRIDLHNEGVAANTRDRRDVAHEIEAEVIVQGGVDCVIQSDKEQRIAVWRRTHDDLGGDIGRSARPVFGNEGLAGIITA
jgi:hypothetical protein